MPAANLDTSIGYSVMFFQSATSAFNQCEAAGSILVLPDGRFLTQRPQVAFCLRCVMPTHVAAPSNYIVGEVGTLKAQRTSPWTRRGPLAGRRLATAHYDDTVGALGTGCDLSARSLTMRAPPV